MPAIAAAPNEDVLKSISKGRLIVFSGAKAEYDSWREKFIQCIHLKQSSPAAKALALQASLDTKNPKLRLIANSITLSDEGYRDVIVDLEEDYGGGQRLRQERLKQVLEINCVRVGDLNLLFEYELGLKGYVSAVDQTGNPDGVEQEDETFLMVAGKLDQQLGMRFCDWLRFQQRLPNIRNLLSFVKEEVTQCRKLGRFQAIHDKPHRAQARTYVAKGGESEDEGGPIRPLQVRERVEIERQLPECDACDEQHLLRDCPVFLDMSAQERLDLISEKGRCYRCLRLGHNAFKCMSSIMCKTCGKRHHSLLHGSKTPSQRRQEIEKAFLVEDFHSEDEDEPELPIKVVERAHAAVEQEEVSLGTVPVNVSCSESKKEIEINALHDSGNTVSLLSEEAASALDLKGYQETASICGVGGKEIVSKIKAKVVIASADGTAKESVWVRIVPKPAGTLRAVDWNLHKAKFAHLKHINFPKPCERRNVDLILGTSAGSLISSIDKDIRGINVDDPVAKLTPLGWIASGKMDPMVKMDRVRTFLSFSSKEKRGFEAQEMLVEGKCKMSSMPSVNNSHRSARQPLGSTCTSSQSACQLSGGTCTSSQSARQPSGGTGTCHTSARMLLGSSGTSAASQPEFKKEPRKAMHAKSVKMHWSEPTKLLPTLTSEELRLAEIKILRGCLAEGFPKDAKKLCCVAEGQFTAQQDAALGVENWLHCSPAGEQGLKNQPHGQEFGVVPEEKRVQGQKIQGLCKASHVFKREDPASV